MTLLVIDSDNEDDRRKWGSAYLQRFPDSSFENSLQVFQKGTPNFQAVSSDKKLRSGRFKQDFVKIGQRAKLLLIHLSDKAAQAFVEHAISTDVPLIGCSGGSVPEWFEKVRKAGANVGFVGTPKEFSDWLDTRKAQGKDTPLPWLGEKPEDQIWRWLEPFAALDILLQGYLAIHDPDFLPEETKKGLPLYSNDQALEKARELTSTDRLFRPHNSNQEEGYYWFDECRSEVAAADLADPKQSTEMRNKFSTSEAAVRFIDRTASSPSEEKTLAENAPLSMVVELLRHYGSATPPSLPALWKKPRSQEQYTNLFLHAHDQYVLIVEQLSRD